MPDVVRQLSLLVSSRLRGAPSSPTVATIRCMLETCYLASLKTEESRHVKANVTFADPNAAYLRPPPIQRAAYPLPWQLGEDALFNVATVVKLARAIGQWVGTSRRDRLNRHPSLPIRDRLFAAITDPKSQTMCMLTEQHKPMVACRVR